MEGEKEKEDFVLCIYLYFLIFKSYKCIAYLKELLLQERQKIIMEFACNKMYKILITG